MSGPYALDHRVGAAGVADAVEVRLGELAQEGDATVAGDPVDERLERGERGAVAGVDGGADAQRGRERVLVGELEVARGVVGIVGDVPGDEREHDLEVGEAAIGGGVTAGEEGLGLDGERVDELVDHRAGDRADERTRAVLVGAGGDGVGGGGRHGLHGGALGRRGRPGVRRRRAGRRTGGRAGRGRARRRYSPGYWGRTGSNPPRDRRWALRARWLGHRAKWYRGSHTRRHLASRAGPRAGRRRLGAGSADF